MEKRNKWKRFISFLMLSVFVTIVFRFGGVKTVEAAEDYKGIIVLSDTSTAAKITSQPADKTAVYGNTVTFTVRASGSNLKYQWQYSSNNGANWYDSSAKGCRSASLTITATSKNNKVRYRCRVTGGGKTVYSWDAILTSLPIITSHPQNVTVICGSSATFAVDTRASRATYQWQYSTNGVNWVNSGASGRRTRSITVKSLSGNSSVKYRCVVKNGSVTQISSVATMYIKPKINTQPTDKTVIVGSQATFTVKATGSGLSYQWQYSSTGTTWKNSGASGNKTSTLKITASESNNKVKYRCVVKSGTLSTVTRAAVLNVKPKPLYLTTTDYYDCGNSQNIQEYDEKLTDTYGNSYVHSVRLRSHGETHGGGSSITYLVNSKYNYIDLTIAYDRNDGYTNRKGYVKILVDGKVIYTSSEITNNSKPIHISRSIGENANMLKIVCGCDTEYDFVWDSDEDYAPIIIGSPKLSYKTN
jgi:NPCBM/NEW2 domain./Immunoglobulin I-set domain.